MLFHSIKQYLISVNNLLPILFPNPLLTQLILLEAWFPYVATIAVIAEKKKSSPIAAIKAIIWKPLSSDRSKVVSL